MMQSLVMVGLVSFLSLAQSIGSVQASQKGITLKSSYSVIKTERLEESAKFYEKYFGFKRTFSSDWYISLKTGKIELALLAPGHETIPASFRGKTSNQGIILNFETDQVDDLYKEFKKDGLQIHLPIRDEEFGQRHFISEDPNGIPLDVIKVIPPSAEFLKKYSK